ncbi:MAG: metalloprotease PmbA [Gammaproteobacteria bacterium]|nr:metalloprotease PmbA [Gammaproteobacteria bacterium]
MAETQDFFNAEQLREHARHALAAARDRGASAAEVVAAVDDGLSVTVRLGEIETIERQRDRNFAVTLYFGQRKGSAATSDLAPESIAETVAAAADIARYTAEDPAAGLAPAERMASDFPALDLCHPWALSPEAAIETATLCETQARESDPRIVNSEGASVDTGHGLAVYANTHGFVGEQEGTHHGISCAVIAKDERGMQRDFWYTSARAAEDLDSAEAVGREAARRTLRRLGAKPLSTRKTPVLFAPEVARSLIGHLLGAITGGAQYTRASFLLEAAGERLFPEWVQMIEQPHLARGAGSRSFDAEGVATAERALIENGTLDGYLLGSYSARRLGLETTGNAGGISNLVVEPGGEKPDEPLAALGTGLYVTELIGQGVNGVTGDYSRGAAGFWVENGEIARSVEEVTIAGNLRDMYANLLTIGADTDTRSKIRTGSLLIDNMTLAGE